MQSFRLWSRMQTYKRCLCGRIIARLTFNGDLVRSEYPSAATRYSFSTERTGSHNWLQAKFTGNSYGNSQRSVRNDSARQVKNALSQLNSSIKNMNRIHKADLEKLLLDIKTEELPMEKHGLLLLRCCGDLLPDELPENRLDLAHRIWANMKELGGELQVDHYNTLLKCYAENGYKLSASKFLANMQTTAEPNEETYLLLLRCECEMGNIKQATEVVSLMKEKGYPASEPIFNALVLGHARAGDLESAMGMLALMQTARIPPTAATYTAVLQGLAEHGNVEKLHTTYREAVLKNITFTDEQILKVFKSLVTSGHNNMKEVLKWLPTPDAESSFIVTQTAIHLFHLGYEDAARALLDVLPVPKPDYSSFGVFLIHEMVKVDKPVGEILLLADTLVSDGKNRFAVQRAAESALNLQKIETAVEIFQAMKHRDLPLRPHYFWPLFVAAATTEGEKGVFDILKQMQHFEVSPDFDTLQHYVLPHIALTDVQMVVRKLQDHGLSVGSALSPLVAVLLKSSQLSSAIALCEEYKGHLHSDRLVLPLVVGYVTTRDVQSTVKLLQQMRSRCLQESDWAGQFLLNVVAFRKMHTDPHQFCALIKAFKKAGLILSSFVADNMTVYLQSKLQEEKLEKMKTDIQSMVNADLNIAPTENLTVVIPHPREMGLEDLECHLVELRSKDLNRRGVLRKLLQEYCRRGDLDRALEIKREFILAGYEFSPGMLAMLFDTMVHAGDLEEAENSLQDLRKFAPGFDLDEHKVLDYATLLISKGRYSDGMALLENYAKGQKVTGTAAVSRNCLRLLTAVAEVKDGKETRDVLTKLSKLGYCKMSNVLLGPVIRAYINRNDLKGAVDEYKFCTRHHKCTPLQHELMCCLIKQGEECADLLQEVLNVTSAIHGTPNTLVGLTIALAEMGRTKQLQRFLLDQRGRLRNHLLEARYKRLVNEDKLEALASLAEASRDVTGLDRSALYMHMLQIYSRRGDCDGALQLWTSMQELDDQPTPEFLVMLAALLRSHKRDIPFSVPEGANNFTHTQSLMFSRITFPRQPIASSGWVGFGRT